MPVLQDLEGALQRGGPIDRNITNAPKRLHTALVQNVDFAVNRVTVLPPTPSDKPVASTSISTGESKYYIASGTEASYTVNLTNNTFSNYSIELVGYADTPALDSAYLFIQEQIGIAAINGVAAIRYTNKLFKYTDETVEIDYTLNGLVLTVTVISSAPLNIRAKVQFVSTVL